MSSIARSLTLSRKKKVRQTSPNQTKVKHLDATLDACPIIQVTPSILASGQDFQGIGLQSTSEENDPSFHWIAHQQFVHG